jgi:hypothetical protein
VTGQQLQFMQLGIQSQQSNTFINKDFGGSETKKFGTSQLKY